MYYLKVPMRFLADKPSTDGVNRFRERAASLLATLERSNHVESWATANSDLMTTAAIVDEDGRVVVTAEEGIALERAAEASKEG